jgi:hypothetical protein
MKIRTAHDIGFDELNGRYLNDRKLSRKILALAGFNIQVSEAVIELMSPGSRERRVLETLFCDDTLKQAGNSLTSGELDELLKDNILFHFKDEAEEKRLSNSSRLDELTRSLGLDLSLKLKIDETSIEPSPSEKPDDVTIIDANEPTSGKTIIIATDDEINAEKGAMVLARNAQTALSQASPMTFLATPEGQQRLKTIVEEKMVSFAEKLFDLPSIADPEKFETTLQSLAFVMKAEGNRGHFINAAISTFADRPSRSRKVIAEVMKRYGLNANLMENIVFLCSDRPAPLQVEAINMVMKAMTTSASADEIMMAAVTLVKTLEEDAKTPVRCRALECLAERAELVLNQLPRFLENGRVVPLVKTLLITDPDAYRSRTETLLIAYGYIDAQSVSPELTDDLNDIKNPYVLLTYLTVLESLSPDREETNDLTIRKWRLCLENKTALPGLLTECEERFQKDLPNSLDVISGIIPRFMTEEQVYFMDLFDRSFAKAVKENDTDVAKRLGIYFIKQLLLKSLVVEREIAILKANTIVSPFLPVMCHHTIWLKMEKRFSVLIQDHSFVERFIACGGIFFPEATKLALMLENKTTKAKALELVYKKLTTINDSEKHFKEQKGDLTDAVRELASATMLLCAGHGEIPLRLLFDGAIVISESILSDEEMINELSSGLVVAVEGKSDLLDRLIGVYDQLAKSAHFGEKSLQLFAESFIRNTSINIKAAIEGIKRVCASPLLTDKLLLKIFLDFQKSIPDQKHFGLQIMKIYQLMAKSSVSHPEITEHLLQTFIAAVRANVPPPPSPDGFIPETDELTNLAMTGLVALVETKKINESKVTFVKKNVEVIIASRPEKVMSAFKKNVESYPIPDNYKTEMETFLPQFD